MWNSIDLSYLIRYARWKKISQHLPSSPVLNHPYMTRPEPDTCTSSTDTGEEESMDTVEEDELWGRIMLLYLYLYTGNYSLRFIFAPFALLSAGEFKTGQIPISHI